MNETQTRVLIQRELDGNLSQEEETRLRRVLLVSDSANSFRSNLSQVAAVAQGLDLPEYVRPVNSSQLANEILNSLTTTKRSFWEPFFTLFSNREKSETVSQIPPHRQDRTQVRTQEQTQARTQDQTYERTTGPLPQMDQYVTGTHAAVGGGLAKKLNKNQQNLPTEEKSVTLADAIRARIHDARPEPHHVYMPEQQVEPLIVPQIDFRIEPPSPAVSQIQINVAPSISLTIIGQSIVSATNIPAINVSTQSVVVNQNVQPEMARPVRSFHQPNTSPDPVIVPVVRAQKSLPIDAITERINTLFQDPKSVQPPTVLPASIKEPAPPVMQQTGRMDEHVDACLSSVGRLSDIRYATNSPGTITNVGNFLLNDQNRKSVENFIASAKNQSGARVFTYEAAQELTELLKPIAEFRNVLGYVICGYDGLLIANTLQSDYDAESIAGCALVSYMNSHAIMKVLGYTKIKQSISLTQGGYLILADFGRGLLTVLIDGSEIISLAELSDEIDQITRD
ncbi:MAG: roadblock/LC7 domain-containing protein [Leptolyngbya sp.]|nr:roadblock/LC7 domain-containing protein [Candidatus Melainabacteria bacterium]